MAQDYADSDETSSPGECNKSRMAGSVLVRMNILTAKAVGSGQTLAKHSWSLLGIRVVVCMSGSAECAVLEPSMPPRAPVCW